MCVRAWMSMRSRGPLGPSKAFAAFVFVVAGAVAAGCALMMHDPHSTLDREPTAEEAVRFWVDPADLERRDLFYGAGGETLAPDPKTVYEFVKRKKGTSPGYTVRDPKGLEWSAKLGEEAQSEVAVSRLLWAIGYHQPPAYYVESWSLAGGPHPGAQTGGRFRPDLPSWKEAGQWSWYENPYVGTRPYRGLIVFMRIVNNWDLLDRNNLVYEVADARGGARRLYVVKDLGASLGRTQIVPHQGTKNVLAHFERQHFIKQVGDGEVRFDDVGRRHRGLYQHISPADVRWTCTLLSRLTAKQWTDAFRAAGYRPDEAERFIRKIQEKVQQGLSLPAA